MNDMQNNTDIDFVITWVDNEDPKWQSDFLEYTTDAEGDKRISRYRNWDNLKYLLRGMERFAPWHRRIFLVTYGHTPDWLNADGKLTVVKHDEFIDKGCLPVFSSHPLEMNLHKIPGLSEQFVYFNDDTFLLKPLAKERFFRKNLPCDVFAFNAISDSMIAHIKLNDIQVINRNFDKYSVLRKNFFKVFHYNVGLINLVKTLLLLPWPKMTGFYDPHLAQPYLKKTFNEVWECEPEVLEKTQKNSVRSNDDVNQYLFRYWHLCQGQFYPTKIFKHYFDWIHNHENALSFRNKILSGKYEMVCINDAVDENQNFDEIRDTVNFAFQKVLPEKSCYEL